MVEGTRVLPACQVLAQRISFLLSWLLRSDTVSL